MKLNKQKPCIRVHFSVSAGYVELIIASGRIKRLLSPRRSVNEPSGKSRSAIIRQMIDFLSAGWMTNWLLRWWFNYSPFSASSRNRFFYFFLMEETLAINSPLNVFIKTNVSRHEGSRQVFLMAGRLFELHDNGFVDRHFGSFACWKLKVEGRKNPRSSYPKKLHVWHIIAFANLIPLVCRYDLRLSCERRFLWRSSKWIWTRVMLRRVRRRQQAKNFARKYLFKTSWAHLHSANVRLSNNTPAFSFEPRICWAHTRVFIRRACIINTFESMGIAIKLKINSICFHWK